jgi:hypothetical protein
VRGSKERAGLYVPKTLVNTVLMITHDPAKVTGEWRKLYENEVLRIIYLPNK